MLRQPVFGVGALEAPVGDRRQVDSAGQRHAAFDPRGGHDHLARGEPGDFLQHQHGGVVALKLGGGELARRDVGVGNSGGRPRAGFEVADRVDRHQVIRLVLGEQFRLGDRAGRDHADDFALDQSLAVRLGDLLAHGDVIALFDQPGDVALDGVMRHARHRDALAFADRAAGQHQIKLARGDLGVFVERLVKVAQSKQDDTVLILAFDIQILLT